jgi:hypothetical protein
MPQPPFDNPPLLLGNPSPYSLELSPYLLGIPSFVSWRESPSILVPGWLYTNPPPSSSFPFPLANGSPSQMHALLRRHCDIGFTQSDTIRDLKLCLKYAMKSVCTFDAIYTIEIDMLKYYNCILHISCSTLRSIMCVWPALVLIQTKLHCPKIKMF